MTLSINAIDEFKKIYKDDFKEDLSDNEAYEMAANLIDLFTIIYRPIPGENIMEREIKRN